MLTDQEIDASLIRAKQDFAAAKDMPPSSVETCLTKNILFRSYLARAWIAANNAKALADLKPAEKAEILDSFDAWELYRTANKPQYYSVDQASALKNELQCEESDYPCFGTPL